MGDERSALERRLLRRAGDWGMDGTTGPLLREAADVIGEARRIMQHEIDDNTGMSGYRLLGFQAVLDRMGRDEE